MGKTGFGLKRGMRHDPVRADTMLRITILMLLLAGFGGSLAASAAERMALVIGNGQYAHSPYLNNPPRDAAAIARALQNLGFTVTGPLRDQSKAQMEAALKDFGQRAQNAAAAVASASSPTTAHALPAP